MWLQFSLGCVISGLSGGFVAAALIRMFKSEGNLSRLAQALADKGREHEALGAQLANCEQQVHQQAGTIEALQSAMVAKDGRLAAANQRSNDLEQQLQGSTEQEQEHLRQVEELESAMSARSGELEGRIEGLHGDVLAKSKQIETLVRHSGELERDLASGEEELQLCTSAVETLRVETLALGQQIAILGEQRAELEQQLQRQSEQEQDRLRNEQELNSVLRACAGELEGQLATRDETLRQREAAIESLQAEVDAKSRQVEALGQRLGELGQQEQGLQENCQREQELKDSWSARAAQLEGQLASREDLLNQRAVAIELLHGEVGAKNGQIDAQGRRCDELQQQLQRQVEQDQESLRREQEEKCALSARAAELEGQLASRDEQLQQRAEAIETLQRELAEKSRQAESGGNRCVELERQLQQQTGHEQELANAGSARAGELEAQLAVRDTELEQLRSECTQLRGECAQLGGECTQLGGECTQLRGECTQLGGECTQLTDRCKALSEHADLRVVDLRARELHIAEIGANMEVLNFAIQACHEDALANQALIGELADQRISALFKRRSIQLAGKLPSLYLDGLAQGDLGLALQGLLGDAEPLSAASVAWLSGRWRDEHAAWKKLPLEGEVVYLWAEGIYLKAGQGAEGAARLLIVASFADGSRSAIAAESGDRESKETWLAMLQVLLQRGMNRPRLVAGAHTLGLWAAIDELGWDCAQQHCWSQKTAEVLAALPKKRQSQAAKLLLAMSTADTRAKAKKLRDRFVKRCGVRLAAAGELLCADWKQLTNYYAFPSDDWPFLRTTNTMESPLTTLRLRAGEPKSGKHTPGVDAILWKILTATSKNLRRLSAPELPALNDQPEIQVKKRASRRSRVRSA